MGNAGGGRYIRDTSEIHPRYIRDTSETHPRYIRNTSETHPRYIRDTSEIHPNLSTTDKASPPPTLSFFSLLRNQPDKYLGARLHDHAALAMEACYNCCYRAACTCYLPLAPCYLPCMTYYLLLATFCLLPMTYYRITCYCIACYELRATSDLLPMAYYLLLAIAFFLRIMCNLLRMICYL